MIKDLYDSACAISAQREDEIQRLHERIRNMELAQAEVDKVYFKLIGEIAGLKDSVRVIGIENSELERDNCELVNKIMTARRALCEARIFLVNRDATFAAALLTVPRPSPLTKMVVGAIEEMKE